MERAILINRVEQLKYLDKGYSRLYFGNEFCERLIPSAKDLEKALCFVRRKGMNFSLLTPYVTDFGLGKLKSLLNWLSIRKINCEIIINDWGTLSLVNREYPNLSPVLGRLLTKQKRGPRLIKLLKRQVQTRFIRGTQNSKVKFIVFQKKLPLGLDCYYKGSNTSSVPIIHDFLINQRIRRIELDNVGQGLFLDLPKGRICASVYLPYVYITTTFFCPTAGCDQKKRSLLKVKPCKRQCQRYVFELRLKSMHKLLYLKGNSQFYKNNRIQFKEWQNSGIDRIVYEPDIPV